MTAKKKKKKEDSEKMSSTYAFNPYLNGTGRRGYLVTLNLTAGIECLKNGALKTPGLILDFSDKVKIIVHNVFLIYNLFCLG